MRKGYLLGMYGSFLCMIILTLAACNSNQTKQTTSDTMVGMADTLKKAAPASLTPISGVLNMLFIEGSEFIRLTHPKGDKKMTFRFFINEQGSLTLKGWSNKRKDPDFPDANTLTLWVGQPTDANYGAGSYFGNQVLYKDQIDDIAGQINQVVKYVVFVPLKPELNGGQITYLVIPTDRDPNTLKMSDVAAFTGQQTNPSPPKGAFN